MINPEVLVVSDVNQSIISTPAIGIDNRRRFDFPLDYALQHRFLTIWRDLCVDLSATLENAEDGLLQRAPAALQFPAETPDSLGPEIAFVDLRLTDYFLKLLMLISINYPAKHIVPMIDRVAIYAQQLSCFRGVNIQTKVLDNFFNPIS